MKQEKFSSLALAQKIKRKYGNNAKSVAVKTRYEREINDYVMSIEDAHKNAANSKLKFGS